MQQAHYSEERTTGTFKGTITRVADGDAAVVYVKLDGKDRTVSFTPRVVRGFRGENLTAFGLRRGRKVSVICEVSSGFVSGAHLIG